MLKIQGCRRANDIAFFLILNVFEIRVIKGHLIYPHNLNTYIIVNSDMMISLRGLSPP